MIETQAYIASRRRTIAIHGNEIANYGSAISDGFGRNYPGAPVSRSFEHEFATRLANVNLSPDPSYWLPGFVYEMRDPTRSIS